jgi:hypothetical protein
MWVQLWVVEEVIPDCGNIVLGCPPPYLPVSVLAFGICI